MGTGYGKMGTGYFIAAFLVYGREVCLCATGRGDRHACDLRFASISDRASPLFSTSRCPSNASIETRIPRNHYATIFLDRSALPPEN